jgi:hypothetical protein
MSALVSRPGIDPRVWLTRAIVTELGFDPANGLFADVQYQPDGDAETCLIGSGYTGNGFGGYCPLKVGDAVIVAVPQGDPAEGPVIIARLWNAADKPPVELSEGDSGGDEPTTVPTFRLEDGSTLRVVARESGTIKLELSGNSIFEVAATGGSKVIIAADTTVEITGSSKVTIASDVNVVIDAPVMQVGANSVLGIARLTDTTIAGTGASALLTTMATSATADAATWTALATALPAVSVPAGASATAAAAVALAAPLAAPAWGIINKASTKGFCID